MYEQHMPGVPADPDWGDAEVVLADVDEDAEEAQ